VRPFSLLIKPASADCNLRCDYCFYLEKCRLYPQSSRHRMSEEVLSRLVRSYLDTEQPVHTFAWQGGEPTLMGLEFFRRVTDLQAEHGRAGTAVANGLQTNATLIDDALAEHLAQYRFLVGCSLDGPARMHNRYRRALSGKPSHADVLRGIRTLQRHQVEFNILVLVSRANVRHAREVYRYLTDQGFLFHQYIPCVEFNEQGEPEPISITGDEWGAFLCAIFKEWYPDDIYTVSVRNFDALLNRLVDGTVVVCTMGDNCCQYFVVEHNGDIYPCDFFVDEDLKLGNIMNASWEDLLACRTYCDFGARKRKWHAACSTCDCLDLCSGDCLKHRMYAGNPPQNRSRLCSGIKQFIGHTRTHFEALAQQVRRERSAQGQWPVQT